MHRIKQFLIFVAVALFYATPALAQTSIHGPVPAGFTNPSTVWGYPIIGGGVDVNGKAQALLFDPSGFLKVNISAGGDSGGATAANQTNVQSAPGTPQTVAITVQGNASSIAIPVSAASLPLPAGASTAAKQPAIGTAGTPSVDVISVQGVSSGTPIPVSGTVNSGLNPASTALNTYSVHLTSNTTTTPTAATGYISSIVIAVQSAGTTSTVTIQDKSGTPLKLVSGFSTASLLSNGNDIYNFQTPVKMTSGIDIVTAGAVAATIDVWINYYQ